MKWWRQIFYDMRWVEYNGSNMTIIRKDLVRLNYALERWLFFDTNEIKLLLLVKRLPPSILQDTRRKVLMASTDVSFIVNNQETHEILHGNVQLCVLFLSQDFYVDLAFMWSAALLEPIRAVLPIYYHGIAYYQNADQTISPLPDIGPLPIGLRTLGLDRDPVSDPWF
jgi:hypothetical protein